MSARMLELTKILIEKGLLKGYTKQEGNTVRHTPRQMTGDKSKAAGAAQNVLARREPLCISSDVLLIKGKTFKQHSHGMPGQFICSNSDIKLFCPTEEQGVVVVFFQQQKTLVIQHCNKSFCLSPDVSIFWNDTSAHYNGKCACSFNIVYHCCLFILSSLSFSVEIPLEIINPLTHELWSSLQ